MRRLTLVLVFFFVTFWVVNATPRTVVAVIPLSNLTQDESIGWLSEGIAATLVTKLGNVSAIQLVERARMNEVLSEIKLGQLGVIDEATAIEAGEFLGADVVVIGEYQKPGDQIRITCRFVDVKSSRIMNIAEVTGSYSKIFELQDEIAMNLIETLDLKLTSREEAKVREEPTKSLSAYEWYSKAYDEYNSDTSNLDLVITYLRKAIDLDPNYVYAHSSLGVAYAHKGLYDDAVEQYKEALRIDPDYAGAHYNLGNHYTRKGLYNDAIREYKDALRIEPHLADAHYNLGLAYYNKGLYDDAVSEYKEALRIGPDHADAHHNLGLAYYNKGLYDDAIRECKEALRIEPDFAEAQYNLALVLETRDKVAALRQWKRYLAVAENDPLKQERIPKAKEHIRKLEGD